MAEKEKDQVTIDDDLYSVFCQRYGVASANNLIIFYEQCRQYGDVFLRQLYETRTYYRYRNVLVRDGYLRLGRFPTTKGGPVRY